MSLPALLRPRLAARALARDPIFGPWVQRIGSVRIPPRDDPPFAYLTKAICHQQLAGAAARTIHARVVEALDGDVSPDRLLAAPDALLQSAGLSRAKREALKDLAHQVATNRVRLDDLERRPDDDIVEDLTRVRGIGPWTAQMFLLFRLRRADVWPTGDLAVRQGYARIHQLAEAPTAKDLEPLGERLRPWRSAAAWYCYRALEVEAP